MTKLMIKLGALKPNKVKKHKTTAKVSGHVPVGGDHKTAKSSK